MGSNLSGGGVAIGCGGGWWRCGAVSRALRALTRGLSPGCGRVVWLVVAAVVVLAGAPARAHQVRVFAVVEGNTIQGEVYYRGGESAQDAEVKAIGPAGEVLGEAKTDEQGKFSIAVHQRCDHRLVVDAGGGHSAEYTISADELPTSLPSSKTPSETPEAQHGEAKKAEVVATGSTATASTDGGEVMAQLESLNGQIVQLRKQLDGYEQKTRFHDVLGGIGYIVGLMGLGGYFLARKKPRQG